MPGPAPFPWHALPRVAHAHVRAASRVRRAYPGANAGAIALSLKELVVHPVFVEVRRVSTATRVDLGSRGPVVVLSARDRVLALEVEAELALAIAGSIAGAKLPKIARGRRVDPEVAGAIAGVAQWLARSFVDDLAIEAVEPSPELLASKLGTDLLVVDAAVRVGVLRTTARLAVAVPELDATPKLAADAVLHALGDTPLSLHAVVARGRARARDLAGLAEGDVVIVDAPRLERCALATEKATFGLPARELPAEGDRLLRVELGAGRVDLAAAAPPNDDGAAMTDETGATMQLPALEEGGRLAEELAELPLEVRIEIGAATLSAREWATLSPGDVVVLDRRVGDPVSLRIGGKILARGELVDVEGALGVRVTERAS